MCGVSMIPLSVNDAVKHPVTSLVAPAVGTLLSVVSDSTGSLSLINVASVVPTPNVSATLVSTLSVSCGACASVVCGDRSSGCNSSAPGSGGSSALPFVTKSTDSVSVVMTGIRGEFDAFEFD